MQMNKVCVVLVLSVTLIISNLTYAKQTKPVVNVLTWWGYLDKPWIKNTVEKACKVTLSIDEFYSNTEFLRRWREGNNRYDAIIFSDTTYPIIKQDIDSKYGDLREQTKQYNKHIRARYLKVGYPKNVVYFVQSVMGFVWNPSVVTLTSQDTIFSIFKKAKSNIVVLVDDPMEINHLLGGEKPDFLNLHNLRNVLQDTTVYVANDFGEIYKKQNFAISYTWSGEGLLYLKAIKNKEYKFFVKPELSNISSDLLAVLNDRDETDCVGKTLTNRNFLTRFQNETFYFSPYGNGDHIRDNSFKAIHDFYLENLPKFSWTKAPNLKEFYELSKNLKLLKLELQTAH